MYAWPLGGGIGSFEHQSNKKEGKKGKKIQIKRRKRYLMERLLMCVGVHAKEETGLLQCLSIVRAVGQHSLQTGLVQLIVGVLAAESPFFLQQHAVVLGCIGIRALQLVLKGGERGRVVGGEEGRRG